MSRRSPDDAGSADVGATRTAFERLVDAWVATHRAPNTRAAYRSDLERYAHWCDQHDLDPLAPAATALASFRAGCEAAGARPSSVARRLSAVGSFLRYAQAHGNPGAADACAAVGRPDPGEASSTRILSDSDANALLEAADALHPKAALLVRLLMLDGLKVGEAVGADADDLNGRPPRVALHLHRNRQLQILRLHHDSASAARAYLDGRTAGPLLLGNGTNRAGARLTRFGADYVLKRVAETARLGDGVSANALRRRYVAAAHDDGVDLDDIRRHAGHVDERTTLRYLTE